MKRGWITLLLMTLYTIGLSACHTVAGMGKDVKEAGEEVEETAEGR